MWFRRWLVRRFRPMPSHQCLFLAQAQETHGPWTSLVLQNLHVVTAEAQSVQAPTEEEQTDDIQKVPLHQEAQIECGEVCWLRHIPGHRWRDTRSGVQVLEPDPPTADLLSAGPQSLSEWRRHNHWRAGCLFRLLCSCKSYQFFISKFWFKIVKLILKFYFIFMNADTQEDVTNGGDDVYIGILLRASFRPGFCFSLYTTVHSI